ncbi:MAG: hypothetical protein SX243_02740 [Acidobacteriota bacterium]|nr:hypothetical protein [Acidobacteriota bacterium]
MSKASRFRASIAFLTLALLWTEVSAETFDAPGLVESRDFLSTELLVGDSWHVEPEAMSLGLFNRYTIQSPYGAWQAVGPTQVLARIMEAQALAELDRVSKSEVFLAAVKQSVTAPLELVEDLATRPVDTLKGIPSGAGRWFRRTQFRVQERMHDLESMARTADSGAEESSEPKSTLDDLKERGEQEARGLALDHLRISSAEHRWYRRLRVDPSTDNEVLREAIRSVARVEGLTSFGMKFVVPSIPGTRQVRRTMDLVWETDPWDLRLMNRQRLLAAGLSEETTRRFEDHPSWTLTRQTALLEALSALEGVRGGEFVLATAIDSSSAVEAELLISAVSQLGRFHREQAPLEECLGASRLPVVRTSDGRLVAILPAERLLWTADLAAAAQEFSGELQEHPAKARELWVSGQATEGFRSGIASLGWALKSWDAESEPSS